MLSMQTHHKLQMLTILYSHREDTREYAIAARSLNKQDEPFGHQSPLAEGDET